MPSSLLSTSLTRHSSMGRACAESGGVLLSSWQKKRRSQRIWPVRSSAPTCTCTWLQRVATQTQHVAAQRVTSLNLWQRSHWRIRNTAVMVLNSSQTHTARASTSPVWEGVTQAAVEDRRSNGALGKPENAELKTMSHGSTTAAICCMFIRSGVGDKSSSIVYNRGTHFHQRCYRCSD